jgi:hypothetical protein
MKVLTAHIPLELAGEVDALAARLDRSRAWIVKQALEEYLGRQARPGGFAEAPARFGAPVRPDGAERDRDGGYDREAMMGGYERSPQNEASRQAAAAHAELLALRETTTLGDISWRELRDAGRR